MTWTSPPTKIVEARDRLLECATVQALLADLTLAEQQARFHYPKANPVTDTMPLFALGRGAGSHQRATAGGSMGRGEIDWALFMPTSEDVGELEEYGADITQEVVELVTDGLYVIEAMHERASNPTPGQEATDDFNQRDQAKSYRTIAGTMTWEG